MQVVDFVVVTQCSLVVGYKVSEEQSGSTFRMWLGYTVGPSFLAGVGSNSHTESQKLTNDCSTSRKYGFIICWYFYNI
jgi:hypothetical protein